MDYREFFSDVNDDVMERYELVSERLKGIKEECENNNTDILEEGLKKTIASYFSENSQFLVKINRLYECVQNNEFDSMSFDELQRVNYDLYMDIESDNYELSFANPEYLYEKLSKEYDEKEANKLTGFLSFLAAEIRACISYAYEFRLCDIVVIEELFLEIYSMFYDEECDLTKEIKSAIYYYVSDYSDIASDYRTKETLDSEMTFATDIIMNSDLSDLRYLFKYGEYISDTEIETARHLNSLSDEEVNAMASTYTEGFRMGFVNNNIDLSVKKTVNIRYQIGFERMVKAAIIQFKAMGLEPVIYRSAVTARYRRNFKVGYCSTSPNRQYDYDHRYDKAVFIDKPLLDKFLVNSRMAYENYSEIASVYAGPACIEIFGEVPFAPIESAHANKLDEKQEKLMVDYNMQAAILSNEYINRENVSFTIIAYPIPDIGENFREIFDATVEVNTLDMDMYRSIHQKIIDALDKGDYVHVSGMNGNKTDLKVNLFKLTDSSKQTIFENCLADVNIPVGEVFTSPVLEGTNGVLHVTEVYLEGLKYIDLELNIENGRIKEYRCANYSDDASGRKFIKDNLLFNHETLPIGEFAIGTNTTAYVMGKKYNIEDKLPILIAEKTGPHFAFGDTCYHMSEERRLYNPDGKEIVAKDNELSILRKTDIDKAYFNCHTDITIPYSELGEIAVYSKDGEKTEIIKNGRFVLEGTEELNKVLEQM